jgi:hypothetical protein
LTVTVAGTNLKLLIVTTLELVPDAACDDDRLGFAAALGLLPPPHPANSSAVPAMRISELMECRGFIHRAYERRRVAQSENPACTIARRDRRGSDQRCGTTAMPYGLLPVATVAVVRNVLGSMIDSVLAPWLAT